MESEPKEGVNKVIVIAEEFTYALLERFLTEFMVADSEPGPILVYICSDGGLSEIGIAIYEIIRTSHNKVITYGIGEVASAATLALIAGDTRIVTEGTTILIHDGNIELGSTLGKAKAAMDAVVEQYDWVCKQMVKRSKLTFNELKELANDETYLTADKAFKLGIVDKVIGYRKTIKD